MGNVTLKRATDEPVEYLLVDVRKMEIADRLTTLHGDPRPGRSALRMTENRRASNPDLRLFVMVAGQ